MANIQIDVEGVEQTLNEIRRDIHRGMEKTADRIADNAKADARSRIKQRDAIFNTEVYSGFKTVETYNSPSRVRVKLYNDVDHAEPLESGAEYTTKGPPVVALLPWVVRKMNWKAASRDTDFDSNKNYIPDSWNGDDDRDDDDDDGDFMARQDVLPERVSERSYSTDDLQSGDNVYIYDGNTIKQREILKVEDDGTVDIYKDTNDYDVSDVHSIVESHPTSDRHGSWQGGDRVYFYDSDDNLQKGFVDGTGYVKEGVRHISPKKDPTELEEYGSVPETKIVDWEPVPQLDNSKVTSDMKRATPTNIDEAIDEVMWEGQDVVIYNGLTGETKTATLNNTPISDDRFSIETEDGENIDLFWQINWEIKHQTDFSSLNEDQQKSLMLDHFDNQVDKNLSGNVLDADTENAIRHYIKNTNFEVYDDYEDLGRRIFNWKEITQSTGRAHVGNAGDGWRLQVSSYDTSNNYIGEKKRHNWEVTYNHEWGHTYSRTTSGTYSIYSKDPDGYDLADPWNKQSDTQFKNFFDSGLPDWEFDDSDPFHAVPQAYMHSDQDAHNQGYIKYDSNGDLVRNERYRLDPYGFDSWRDEIAEKAKANANGKTVAESRMTVSTRELTERQVFNPDKGKDNIGDRFVFDKDGEEVVYELTNFEGDLSTFSGGGNGPRQGYAVGFKQLSEDRTSFWLYADEDGNLWNSKSDGNLPYLDDKDSTFIGKAQISNYDESVNEFPDLVNDENPKKVQEAANMAWWYQAKFIENDNSVDKEDSHEIVLKDGYSSTYQEEVMSTFTEAIKMQDPDQDQIDDVKMLVDKYPYFIEAYLEDRSPVSDEITKLLKSEGFDV